MRLTIYATVVLIGMIVGVGIFGVPFVVAQSGFAIGIFWLLFLGTVSLLISFLYSEVTLATAGKHRLVGYASIHLGKFGKYLASLTNIFGFWGAQVAYIIIGGKFLHLLLGGVFGGTELIYNIIFFVVMAFFILCGLRLVEGIELGIVVLLILIILSIFGWGVPKMDWHNFAYFDWHNFFVPYGVALFALGGAAAIPEMQDILKKNWRSMKTAVVSGTLIAVLITFIFVFTVVGVTGSNTTSEALLGLSQLNGSGLIILLGTLFGILAISSSFLVLGLNLKGIFQYDYKLGKIVSWFLTVIVPFVVFWIGAQSFIKVIDLTGAVFGGLDGIIIALMFLKLFFTGRLQIKSRWWPGLAWLAVFIFTVGILGKVIHIF